MPISYLLTAYSKNSVTIAVDPLRVITLRHFCADANVITKEEEGKIQAKIATRDADAASRSRGGTLSSTVIHRKSSSNR